MKIFSKKQSNKGFSIIEVIVAVGIITIGIIPIISLFTMNLNNEIKNKNRLIAAYLANESIEIVRQERDDNWTAVVDWMAGILADGSEVIVGLNNEDDIKEGWEIVTSNANREKVYLSNDSYVQLKSASPGSWKETPFVRYLEITENEESPPGSGTYTVAGCLGTLECVEIVSYVKFNGTEIAKITAYLYDGWR